MTFIINKKKELDKINDSYFEQLNKRNSKNNSVSVLLYKKTIIIILLWILIRYLE